MLQNIPMFKAGPHADDPLSPSRGSANILQAQFLGNRMCEVIPEVKALQMFVYQPCRKG